MSACAQLVIAFLLILLQLGIIVALLIIEPPQVRVHVFSQHGGRFICIIYTQPQRRFVSSQVIYDYPSIREVHLICNLTTLGVVAPLGYNGLLILSCTFYAFKVLPTAYFNFFFLCTRTFYFNYPPFFSHRPAMFQLISTRPSILPLPCTPPASSGWPSSLFTLAPTTRS